MSKALDFPIYARVMDNGNCYISEHIFGPECALAFAARIVETFGETP